MLLSNMLGDRKKMDKNGSQAFISKRLIIISDQIFAPMNHDYYHQQLEKLKLIQDYNS